MLSVNHPALRVPDFGTSSHADQVRRAVSR